MARGKQHTKKHAGRPGGPPRSTSQRPLDPTSPMPGLDRGEAGVAFLSGGAAVLAFVLALVARTADIDALAWAALVIAVVAALVSGTAWWRGERLDRNRLPLVAPAALAASSAAIALGVVVSGAWALALSIVVALASAGLMGIALSGRRRRGGS